MDGLLILTIIVGIVNYADCQGALSLPEPLYARGCRASRGQFAHETYCWQYYNCWDGRATIEECPGRLHFNPVIGQCDYADQVNCGGRLRNPEPSVTPEGRCLKQFGVFPDQTDCTTFYECSFGRAFRQRCPYYTAFDERYLVCVHAHDVECGGRGGFFGTLSPPIYGVGATGGAGGSAPIFGGGGAGGAGGSAPLVNVPGSGTAASDQERQYEKPLSPEASFRCPQPRGLYPSALDCSRFWLCREYKPSLLKCPEGQLFDLASLSCTYPEKAQCSSLTPRT